MREEIERGSEREKQTNEVSYCFPSPDWIIHFLQICTANCRQGQDGLCVSHTHTHAHKGTHQTTHPYPYTHTHTQTQRHTISCSRFLPLPGRWAHEATRGRMLTCLLFVCLVRVMSNGEIEVPSPPNPHPSPPPPSPTSLLSPPTPAPPHDSLFPKARGQHGRFFPSCRGQMSCA